MLYLESFQCANSWFTVDESNCNLYIIEQAQAGDDFTSPPIAQIQTAPYDSDSFGQALENALNNGKIVSGTYSVSRMTSNASSAAAIGNAAFRFYGVTLTGGGNFSLPDMQHLCDPEFYLTWLVSSGLAYDKDQLRPPTTWSSSSVPGQESGRTGRRLTSTFGPNARYASTARTSGTALAWARAESGPASPSSRSSADTDDMQGGHWIAVFVLGQRQ